MGWGARHRKHFWIIGGILVVLFALTTTALFLTGTLRPPSQLTLTDTAPTNCTGSITYAIELTGPDGLQNDAVSVAINGIPIERLRTDQNGRFSSSIPMRPEWCGTRMNLTASYEGTLFHAPTTASVPVLARIPTILDLAAPEGAQLGDTITLRVRLTNANTPVMHRPITITARNDLVNELTTDNDGYATLPYTPTLLGATPLQARFAGDDQYLPSDNTKTVTVTRPACDDGTLVATCATTPSYYCNADRQLVMDCTKCGCASGLVCYDGACVTQEQKNTVLISALQRSIVYVRHSTASGSGIVLATSDGNTIILTNHHVVADATGISDVQITTDDRQTVTASDVRIAPDDMDLAVITVPGTLGTPVQHILDTTPTKGENVVVLGSPLGLQGAVAQGIVSNLLSTTTTTGRRYNVIQTDAAVNHGNSGGGLFLEDDGTLIGVTTFTLTDTQGLNFAIDIRELQNLPPYTTWPRFTPTPKCQDGTPYSTCSTANVGYMCMGGSLVGDCKTCGCPAAYPYCPNSGTCFSCKPGTTPYQTSSGQGFCCASGYQGTTDGHCM